MTDKIKLSVVEPILKNRLKMNIKSKIENGRLIIESDSVESALLLDKWIKENKKHLSRFLDLEILAHDEHDSNNNGWIKIESESDLPKENIECFYVIEIPEKYSNHGTQINIGSFKFGKNLMSGQSNYFTCDNFFYHRFPFVTHYQPIVKPQPPIY